MVVLPIHCTAVAEWKTVFSRARYIHFAEISPSGMSRRQSQAEIDYPCCSCQLSMVQNLFKVAQNSFQHFSRRRFDGSLLPLFIG